MRRRETTLPSPIVLFIKRRRKSRRANCFLLPLRQKQEQSLTNKNYIAMKKSIFLITVMVLSCLAGKADQVGDKTSYVNPLIGTEGMGHTFPGACAPFGIVQLSPQTWHDSHCNSPTATIRQIPQHSWAFRTS